MQTYRADLHAHTDYDEERRKWHGMPPAQLAQAVVDSDLDIIALTEHNGVGPRYFELRQRIADLLGDSKRAIAVLLGMELSVGFDGNRYHVGYLYEEEFPQGHLPETPEAGIDVKHLEGYRTTYPGVAILNHPTWKHGCPADRPRTAALMQSGFVEGVEILNGSVLVNGNGHGQKITTEACELFVAARQQLSTLAAVGSSDAHKPNMIASAVTTFEGASPRSLFRAMRRGQTMAVAGNNARVREGVAGILTKVPGIEEHLKLP